MGMRTGRVFFVALFMFLAGGLAGLSTYHMAADVINPRTIHQPPVSFAVPMTLGAAPSQAADVPGPVNFVTEVYKKVGPSVVNIITVQIGYDFFLRPIPQEGVGSGVILNSDGYIITNNHVVKSASEIRVILANGTEVGGKVIGADPGTDLALVKITPPEGYKLPVALLGNSENLEVGEWVVAVGNPLGLDQTVTVGVVSALGRSVMSEAGVPIEGLIQTDAAINPGNSGGPLINVQGEVIGINTAIVSRSGGSEGIGLAIPINTAKSILDQLIAKGRVERPWLGVEVQEIYPRLATRYGLPTTKGLLLKAVYKDSPAQKAGMHKPITGEDGGLVYFIIVEANGITITKAGQLLQMVRELKVGSTINLRYYKNNQLLEKEIPLAPLPEGAPLTAII